MALTQRNALQIANQWLEDWNRHDLDAILTHYAEDIHFTSPFIVRLLQESSGVIQGKTALRDYFARGLAAYPDLKFELLQILTSINSIVIYYRSVNDLLAAEFMVINPEGLICQVVAHYSDS